MLSKFLRNAAAAAALLLLVASPVRAGQFRIGVSSFAFVGGDITVNAGDHVIWVWSTGMHTVTSGDPDNATSSGDGLFRNTTAAVGVSNGQFAWRVSGSGVREFYCFPHAPDMRGSITISGTPQSSANFRITEVEFGAPGGADRVQIANLGSATMRVDGFKISSVNAASSVLPVVGLGLNMAAGARLTIHLNASGTNTATDVYFPSHPQLGTAGSFALYVPNNSSSGSTSPASLNDANQIVDYVEWGTSGQAAQPNRSTAEAAALWLLGDVVNTESELPGGGAGYSISFCGGGADRGASFWSITTPNFGANPICTTPTRNPTWGQIKARYR